MIKNKKNLIGFYLVISFSLPSVLTLLLILCLTDGLDVGLPLNFELVRALLAVLRVTLGLSDQVALGDAALNADRIGLCHTDVLILSVTFLGFYFLVVSVECSLIF